MLESILNKIFNYPTENNISKEEKTTQRNDTPKTFIEKINSLPSDVERILEFEKLKGDQKAFIIINKTNSQATVYKEGKIIDKIEVGVGETFGDDLNTVEYSDGKFSDYGKTTPSGKFRTLSPYDYTIKNKDDYTDTEGINMLLLKGVQHPADYKQSTMLALHQIPKTSPEREELFNTTGSRRSMSTGCVNFKTEDFKRLITEILPTGTSVYILPEEKGNSLELVSLDNGLWFKTKYADEEKNNILERAIDKFFKPKK